MSFKILNLATLDVFNHFIYLDRISQNTNLSFKRKSIKHVVVAITLCTLCTPNKGFQHKFYHFIGPTNTDGRGGDVIAEEEEYVVDTAT